MVPKIGCIRQTLLGWVKHSEIKSGQQKSLSSEERKRLKTLECENKELHRANEILRTASTFFAQVQLKHEPKS
jgi:transposase-like protein